MFYHENIKPTLNFYDIPNMIHWSANTMKDGTFLVHQMFLEPGVMSALLVLTTYLFHE